MLLQYITYYKIYYYRAYVGLTDFIMQFTIYYIKILNQNWYFKTLLLIKN